MKKGVAVSTLILIILGVVVLGLVGYALYRVFTKVPPAMSLEECRKMVLTRYCPDVIVNSHLGYDNNRFNCDKNYEYTKPCRGFQTELGVDSLENVQKTCGVTFT